MNFLSFFLLLIHRARLAAEQWMAIKMYSGGSVVGKALTIGIYISPIPPLIFTGGGQKWVIWSRFQHHSTLSRPRLQTQRDIRTLEQKCNAAMIALCPRQVW